MWGRDVEIDGVCLKCEPEEHLLPVLAGKFTYSPTEAASVSSGFSVIRYYYQLPAISMTPIKRTNRKMYPLPSQLLDQT